jgi:hypothetical protein
MIAALRTKWQIRFSLSTLLFLTLCVAGLLGGFRSGFLWGYARGVGQAESERAYPLIYDVADFDFRCDSGHETHTLEPLSAEELDFGCSRNRRSAVEPCTYKFECLKRNIVSAIDPTAWQGYSHHVGIFEPNKSFVIRQTRLGHQCVTTLLQELQASTAKKHRDPSLANASTRAK